MTFVVLDKEMIEYALLVLSSPELFPSRSYADLKVNIIVIWDIFPPIIFLVNRVTIREKSGSFALIHELSSVFQN